jgi:hypothetical protein
MSIERELLDLQKAAKDKILRAESVVDFARRNPKCELHSQFEWDDSLAAHQHRLWQARQVIQIHLVDARGDPTFVSLRFDRVRPRGGYRKIDDVLSSKKLSALMLADALADLETVRERYQRVRELTDVWDLVDKKSKANKKRKGKVEREDQPQP